MTDSMKFGPEWLRNLSGDSCNSTSSGGGSTSLTTPRYQLAEHRYGREEMLILFDRNCKPPEPLTTFSSLYVEKTQLPLALIQMTEDETRMWNGGISNVGGSRGRGGSVDRGGRGRNGRGGLYSSHYSRGVGFDDSGDGTRIDGQPFPGRNRPFDRSQSERGWSERNGVSDPGEWNGSTSPRKELSRGASGSSLMESNWRRHRAGTEDDDGWRKWGGRNSWREGGSMDRDRLERNEGDGEEGRPGGSRWEHRGTHRVIHDSSHHPPPRTARTWESNHHDNNHDNLPEWATENPSESGGSFDASGAFHGGMYSDDDEDGVISAGGTQESRTRRVSEGSAANTTKPGNKPLSYSSAQGQLASRSVGSGVSAMSKERAKSLHHPLDTKDDSIEKERRSGSPPVVKPAAVTAAVNTPSKGSASQPASQPEIIAQKSRIAAAIAAAGTEQTETEVAVPADTEINKSPSKEKKRDEVVEAKDTQSDAFSPNVVKRQSAAVAAAAKLQAEETPQIVAHNTETGCARQRSEDDLDRMKEEADALVAKLMADEESHREKSATSGGVPPSIGNQPTTVPTTNGQEKWFYRDPQGEVQGPFLASEMTEWCKAGYFTAGLMVRRTCDERYATLGDLMKMCGRIPFTPGPTIPPLKLTDQVIPPVPNTVPAGMSALPKPGIDDPLLLIQYQQMRMLQNQQLLLRQIRASAIAKLSQSEHWATLSPVEQNQLIFQRVLQDSDMPDVPITASPFVPHLPAQASNPVMQLFTQMQQAKTPPEAHLATNPLQHAGTPPSTAPHPPALVDPIQQLIQQMGGVQNISRMQQQQQQQPPPPPPPQQQQQPSINSAATAGAATQEDDPIKSLLRQLNINTNGHPQASHMDTVWPQPPPQINPQFNAQNWLAQVGPIPAVPPGQLPTSLWDLHTNKEIKTEQQILEEQNLRLQEDRKKEELRKQEELQRQAEEENAKRKKEEQAKQAEEAKRKDEERKRKEEEKKRKEEEKRKQEEERKKKEEKKRKEEEKKREEKRKLQEEENLRKKQEEEKRKKEELKKQEEKLKKEEEKRKKLEEEQRKQEEERIRKEAEARKQAEAEEQARRAEQRRREADALRRLQERSKAPWAQAPRAPAPATPAASLAEIQRLEREKKAEEQRFQQIMQQQKAMEAAQEAAAVDSSKRLQFKWAEKATGTAKSVPVKSLAQIQQEEQERIAKVKQQERERQEKAGQKESTSVLQNAGIWGTASQCLNWANSSSSSNNQAWSSNSGSSGFWDDPTLIKSSGTAKPPAKQSTAMAKATPIAATAAGQQQQQQQQQPSNKANKSKNKREEELVKKLFEQNTAKTDDFTQWCNKALSGLQVSVDIPTFVGFLRDIESAYEVKEYVRDYLGDNKQSSEFAKQFLEKRSKWRSAQRPQAQADDLCKPAPAVNPNAPTEFQEVKGKSKKPKKGKMYKVDNRILGFSVTAAPDRINVGDRDYGEGV